MNLQAVDILFESPGKKTETRAAKLLRQTLRILREIKWVLYQGKWFKPFYYYFI